LPINLQRAKQARWLDSDELDDLVYDFASRTFVPDPTTAYRRRMKWRDQILNPKLGAGRRKQLSRASRRSPS
jgi:hypothetical protein